MGFRKVLHELALVALKSGVPIEVATGLVERQIIVGTLEKWGWNQVRAAEALNMHRNTMSRLVAKYSIQIPPEGQPRKHAKRRGRSMQPLCDAGDRAREAGLNRRMIRENGLDREIGPLALQCRLNQIKRAERRQTRLKAKDDRVGVMTSLAAIALSLHLTAEDINQRKQVSL